MKVILDIPQIFCKNVTHPRTARDEIYICYFVTLAKPDENGTLVRKHVAKRISPVKTGVKKKSRWIPTDTTAVIEVGDATSMFVTLALYECDDKDIYKEIKDRSDVIVNPEDFDWSCIDVPTNLTDWFGWVKAVWKIVVTTFNFYMQDDLLGTHSIAVPNLQDREDTSWEGLRELKFKAFGGDYRATLAMMVEPEVE